MCTSFTYIYILCMIICSMNTYVRIKERVKQGSEQEYEIETSYRGFDDIVSSYFSFVSLGFTEFRV
jgi:hypothetical protein